VTFLSLFPSCLPIVDSPPSFVLLTWPTAAVAGRTRRVFTLPSPPISFGLCIPASLLGSVRFVNVPFSFFPPQMTGRSTESVVSSSFSPSLPRLRRRGARRIHLSRFGRLLLTQYAHSFFFNFPPFSLSCSISPLTASRAAFLSLFFAPHPRSCPMKDNASDVRASIFLGP